MWIRGTLLLLFALTIDALQIVMGWIFLTAGSALAIIPVIGLGGPPLGVALGFGVDIAISITMGSGLILALFLSGILDVKYIAPVFIGEALPGLDIIPGWTLLVVRCIMKKNAKSAVGIAGLASNLASGALSPGTATGLGRVTAGLTAIKSDTRQMAQSSPAVKNLYDSEPIQNIARERTQLASDVGREIAPKPPRNPNLNAKTA